MSDDSLRSINDLRVVITSNIEGLESGVSNAREILQRFGGEGNAALGLIDGGFAKIGAGIEAARGKMGVWLAVAEGVASIAGRIASEGEKVGRALGEEEKVDQLKAALADLSVAASEGVTGAMGLATQALGSYALGLTTAADGTVDSTSRMKTAFADLAAQAIDAVEYAAQGLRNIGGGGGEESVAKIQTQIKHVEAQMKDLMRLRDEAASGKNGGFLDWLADARVDRYTSMIGELTEKLGTLRDRLGEVAAISAASWSADVSVTNDASEKAAASLERQVRAARERAAADQMSAGAAASYLARIQAINAVRDGGAEVLPGDMTRINASAAEIGRLAQAKADATAAAAAEREAAAVEKRGDTMIANLTREVLALQAKRAALVDGSRAAQIAAAEEAVLNDLRARGLSSDQAIVLQAQALARSRVEAAASLQEMQSQLRVLQQAGDIVGRGLEGAFKRWADGAKVNSREMVASVLADLAMLTFRQSVSQPMIGGLTSILGGLFAGFRAEGGPVSAGSAYVVGERGPELFMPATSGDIIPNHALALASKAPTAAPVTVHVHHHIDARGAYPESISEIRAALAEQQQSLPGRVLELVGDAQQRGGI